MPYEHGQPVKKNQGPASAPQLFRAVIHFTDPDGVTRTRYEGLYEKPHVANARVTFWNNRAETDPKFAGWKVDGHPEICQMTWSAL